MKLLFELLMEELTERKKKLTYDEKFLWISKNIGNWLWEEIFPNFSKIKTIPFYEKFKNYLILKTKVNVHNDEDFTEALLNHYYDFLNVMQPRESEDVIDEIKKHYPKISQSIARYERKEVNPNERRGRKSKPVLPKTFYTLGGKTVDMGKYKSISDYDRKPEKSDVEPVSIEPEMSKPIDNPTDVLRDKRGRGRPKMNLPYTAAERALFKKQGVEYIQHLESKFKEYDDLANEYIKRAQQKLKDIEKRKEFFGIKDEINESIIKLKSDFKRFLLS